MTQGREAIVRFINHGDRAVSQHLHGSYSRAPFDGYADDITEVGQYKDYYYPNRQNARTLWYHDHAVDHTAENVYFGLVGFYIMHDSEELALGLPLGDYDIPLLFAAKRYNSDGTLWDPEKNGELTSVYGDVIEVNGQPWPYLKVEPRKYRFRFLDGGISRTFKHYLQADQQNNKGVNMTIIGSDAGLLQQPVNTDVVTQSIAERWEVIIDFTQYAGQNLTLRNQKGVGADADFAATDRTMRFVVGNTVSSQAGNGAIPNPLRQVPFPPQTAIADRVFKFTHDNEWKINGITWGQGLATRLLARPQRGSIEIWELVNGGGGWSHPIHVHLVDFQVIGRTGSSRAVLPYEAAGQQDVVWVGPGETVKLIARFSPWPGRYMFHCHNLIHEDHEMLAEFNVTQVDGLGLNETELFSDPMEAQYRAVAFNEADFQKGTGPFAFSAVQDKVNFFANKKAYQDVDHVEKVLEQYWANKSAKEKRGEIEMEHGMPAHERFARLNGYKWDDVETPKIKGRTPDPNAAPQPVPEAIAWESSAHLAHW